MIIAILHLMKMLGRFLKCFMKRATMMKHLFFPKQQKYAEIFYFISRQQFGWELYKRLPAVFPSTVFEVVCWQYFAKYIWQWIWPATCSFTKKWTFSQIIFKDFAKKKKRISRAPHNGYFSVNEYKRQIQSPVKHPRSENCLLFTATNCFC